MTATVTTVRKAGAELELESGHPAFAGIDHLVQHGDIYHAADVLQVGQEVTVRTGAWHPQPAASPSASASSRPIRGSASPRCTSRA